MSLSRWDEHVAEAAFWRGLVERLTSTDMVSDEFGERCFFCGAQYMTEWTESEGLFAKVYHESDCDYAAAKTALQGNQHESNS